MIIEFIDLDRLVNNETMEEVVEIIYPQYMERVEPRQGQIRSFGKQVVRAGFDKATAPPSPIESEPTWVNRLVNPIMDPFKDGAMEEARNLVKPYIVKGSIVAALAATGFFFLGRATKG